MGRKHHVGRWPATQADVEFDVGLDRRGNATIVWSTLPPESSQGTSFGGIGVHARVLKVNGKLSRRIDVPLGGGGNIHPRVVVSASGNATVLWEFLDGPGPAAIHAANIRGGGRLGPVSDISRETDGAYLGDVAVDSGGTLTVAWSSSGPSGSNAILVRRVRANGSLGPIFVLATGASAADTHSGPRVVPDGAGNAIVAWYFSTQRPPDKFSTTVEERRIDLSGNLGPLTDAAAPFADIGALAITVDAAGNQTLGWVRLPLPLQSWNYIVQARRIERSGSLGAVETFASGTCPACYPTAPSLFSDADGVVTAVWLEPQPGLRAAIKLSRFAPG